MTTLKLFATCKCSIDEQTTQYKTLLRKCHYVFYLCCIPKVLKVNVKHAELLLVLLFRMGNMLTKQSKNMLNGYCTGTNDAKMRTQKTLAKPKTKAKSTRCSIEQSPFKPGMLRFPRSSLDVGQSVGNFKSGSAQLVPLKLMWSWQPVLNSSYSVWITLGECQFYLCLCRSSLF